LLCSDLICSDARVRLARALHQPYVAAETSDPRADNVLDCETGLPSHVGISEFFAGGAGAGAGPNSNLIF